MIRTMFLNKVTKPPLTAVVALFALSACVSEPSTDEATMSTAEPVSTTSPEARDRDRIVAGDHRLLRRKRRE